MNVELDGFQIRSYARGDAESLAECANDARIAANLRDAFPHPYTLKAATEWLEIACAQEPQLNFVIADGDQVWGGIGLVLQEDIHSRTAELGYWLGVDHWGQGIATQAVHWITHFGFKNFDLLRICAEVYEGNPASARVLEKSGFKLEGCLRQAAFKNGQALDISMYSILRDEVPGN